MCVDSTLAILRQSANSAHLSLRCVSAPQILFGGRFGLCYSDRESVPEAIGNKSRGVPRVLVLYF
jgi:hypothetical protein